MLSVTNSKGVTIEYSEKLLDKIREAYGMDETEEVTQEKIFAFFHAAYENAVEKGVIEEE
jgi:hypothetical protein